jgi:hypothetical protein
MGLIVLINNMKHLKKFNESLGDFHNTKLNALEWNTLRIDGIEFDNSEKEDIKNFFAQYRARLWEHPDSVYDTTQNVYKKTPQIAAGPSGRSISIKKLSEDEWYLLRIDHMNSGRQFYWKCDGLDGLFDILEKDMIKLKKVSSDEFLGGIRSRREARERKENIIKKIRQFSEEDWVRLSGIIDNW